MPNYNQAPKLKSVGQKQRDPDKWGFAQRTHKLETIIFNTLGDASAQLRLILFLTGNATDGSFGVAEKTVCDRCGFKEGSYKSARKALVELGWIEHKVAASGSEIIVNYDAIYASEGKTRAEIIKLKG